MGVESCCCCCCFVFVFVFVFVVVVVVVVTAVLVAVLEWDVQFTFSLENYHLNHNIIVVFYKEFNFTFPLTRCTELTCDIFATWIIRTGKINQALLLIRWRTDTLMCALYA